MQLQFHPNRAQALWKEKVFPIYVLWGPENLLKEEAIAALENHCVEPDYREFDREVLDTATHSLEVILSAVHQIPFGSSKRLVIVRGAEAWRDRARAAEAEKLAQIVPHLPPTGCLLLIVSQADEEKRKTVLTPKLDKVIAEHGMFVLCRSLTREEAKAWLVQKAKAQGKTFQPEALTCLLDAVGTDMQCLSQELEKLWAYTAHKDNISLENVRELVTETPEDVIFAAVDATTRRESDRALALLAELHRYDPKPQAVAAKFLTLLARQLRMLWQAKLLIERGISPKEVRDLDSKMADELPSEGSIVAIAFKANELFALAQKWSWYQLAEAMDLLLECDTANKGVTMLDIGLFGADPKRNLQILVLSLVSLPEQAKPTDRVGGHI